MYNLVLQCCLNKNIEKQKTEFVSFLTKVEFCSTVDNSNVKMVVEPVEEVGKEPAWEDEWCGDEEEIVTSGREVGAVEAVKRVGGQDKEMTNDIHTKTKTKKIVCWGFWF